MYGHAIVVVIGGMGGGRRGGDCFAAVAFNSSNTRDEEGDSDVDSDTGMAGGGRDGVRVRDRGEYEWYDPGDSGGDDDLLLAKASRVAVYV